MANKTFKGYIYSIIPSKRMGFIVPRWGKKNEDNIFFHMSETQHHCVIAALRHSEERTTTKNNQGLDVITPKEPQFVYFNIEIDERSKNQRFKAVNIRDEDHVSEEEREEAANNVTKPNKKDLLESKTEVDVKVTTATINSTPATTAEKCEQVEVVDNAEAVVHITTTMAELEADLANPSPKDEPEYDSDYDDEADDYDDRYDEYDDESYYVCERRHSSGKRAKDHAGKEYRH